MIESGHQQKIIRILSQIFPGVHIYYFGNKEKSSDSQGKQPEIDIALDIGRIIGTKDIDEAQKALAETEIPYTIYLYDLNGVSEAERKAIIAKATAWKLLP